MVHALHSLATHAYGAAAVVYLVYLVRQWSPLPLVGRLLVALGAVLHGVGLGLLVLHQGGLPVGMAQAFSALAFLLVLIFLGLDVRYRLPVLGAFLTPFALAVLVPGFLLPSAGGLRDSLRRPLLPVHVSVALIGLAAFGAAAGIAVMYLLLERQMKGKRFGVLFSRIPSLQLLDDLNRRLVIGGFIALSLTVITGAFFVGGASYLEWQPKQVTTLVAWLVFGVLLGARAFAGWNGRRVAVLTMAGFCILVVSFLTAFDPLGGGGLH